MDTLNIFEANILLWIQENIRTDILDIVMAFISNINNAGMLAIAAIIILIVVKRYRAVGFTAMISLISEFVVVNVFTKNIVARTRPYIVNDALEVLGKLPSDYSFPSGHTGSAFAVAIVMFFCMPAKYGVPSIIVAVLMGISRLYNGVHYPTDVLAGAVIGLITGYGAFKYIYKVKAF